MKITFLAANRTLPIDRHIARVKVFVLGLFVYVLVLLGILEKEPQLAENHFVVFAPLVALVILVALTTRVKIER